MKNRGFSCKEIEPVGFWIPDITTGFMIAQEWLKKYLQTEQNKTALFRFSIINYELGSVAKAIVYKEVSPDSPRAQNKQQVEDDIGDALVNLIILAQILHIDSFKAVASALERLENKEWRKA